MSEQSTSWRRAVPVAALALLTATGLASAASAAADPLGASGAAKAAPAAAPARVSDAGCTLTSSLNLKSSHGSCIGVGATLSSVPAVGQTATLSITVKAGRVEKATAVTVDLPTSLAFADGTASTAAVTGAGRSAHASVATVDLTAGATRTFTRTVRAVAAGAGEIKVAATSRVDAHRVDGGADYVHLTVGRPGTASKAGIAQATGNQATVATTAKALDARPAGRASVSLPSAAVPAQRSSVAKAPGTSCATGSWVFQNAAGTTIGAYQSVVQVWRGGSIVASGYAQGSGAYTLCWASGGGTNTVYVRFVESNNAWKVVTNAGNDYAYVTGTQDVADGGTANFGTLQPADGGQHRALHAYYDYAVMYDWIYQNATFGSGCWSPFAGSCQQLVVHWQSDSTTGTFWNSSGVYLLAASPDSEDEPVHEGGHALMYGLYGNTYPATTNCNPHYLFTISSTTCGWTEGWGDWIDTSVWGNTVYTFASGSTAEFNVTWGSSGDTGDQVEARVVQALDSLNDGVKYPFDNDPGDGGNYRYAAKNFQVLRTYQPTTFAAYWNGRAGLGYDTSQNALSALFQGTIDYGFRNPLTDGVPKNMPQAIVAHNYSATTTRGYWSTVAVRPADGSDSDVTLYNDAGLTTSLGSSSYGGSTTDFVAVNSNSGARALQTYYPRVTNFAGSGNYTVEFVQGSSTFSSGTLATTTDASQPVSIRDSYQNAGVPVYYRAVPQNGQSIGLTFLQPGQTVLGRSSGVNSAVGTPGQAVAVSATPAATGYGALVLVNQGMTSGNVQVYADTTAPSGTVTVAGGAATTTKVNAPLQLSATDGETGVVSMQISTDGTFDTEAVLPYKTTATAKLTGSNGVKTVYVRYLNNAGMWSDPVTDTIDLEIPATATTVNPASGPAAGGTTVTVRGTRFTGATAVVFGTKPATSFTVVNDTTISAVSPGGTGSVKIRVTVSAGTATTTGSFQYIPAPVVTSVGPKQGHAGTVVTVNGANFTGATSVKFGSTPGTNLVIVRPSQLRITAPAGTGTVNIQVTTPGGTSPLIQADRFTYVAAPTITAVTPNTGTAGTVVTVDGTNLTGATAVKFGATAGTNVTIVSATRLRVTAPAGSGLVNIQVTTAGGTSAVVVADRFTYTA